MFKPLQILLDTDISNRLPTFGEMVKYYGPYLALVLSLIIVILILQFIWFRKLLRAKDEEINRLIKSEDDLHKRVMTMIDNEIGYKKPQEKPKK